MRILVDATILKPEPTGIGTYVRSLVCALAGRADLVVAAGCPEALAGVAVETLTVPQRTKGFTARQAWREASLPHLVRHHACHAVLVPAPETTVRPVPVPVAALVHDVGPLIAPALFPLGKRLRFRLVPPALRRASAVLAVSGATAAALEPFLGPSHPPVTVIGAGPGRSVSVDPAPAGGQDTPAGRSGTVLYVGTALPHKNLAPLVEAFSDLPHGHLILAGPGTERYRGSPRVEARGWVSDDELLGLFEQADLVVSPSLHEGFGLPALEAMASGRPVLLSPIPSFREVAGEAAAYVDDPGDPRSWARAVTSLLADGPRRARLAAAGAARARLWTWESVARRLAAVLEGLAADPEPRHRSHAGGSHIRPLAGRPHNGRPHDGRPDDNHSEETERKVDHGSPRL